MGNEVAVVLPDDGTALKQAERSWSKSQLRTRLVSSPAALIPRKAGFGKAATTADAPLRVCIVVRPNKATLAELKPIIEPLGREVVTLLVNPARTKSGGPRAGYTATYWLRDNPHPDWRGGLLYRAYPAQWVLAVAAARGRAVVHGRSAERPKLEAIDAAFDEIKSDTSLISQAGGLLSASGAAAALERRALIPSP